MNTYPEITTNTKINEVPEFEIKTITEVPENHPTRQFFNTIFIYIRQILKLFFHYQIEHQSGAEQFYDELSADCIEQIHHGKKQDRIYFQLCSVYNGDYPLWFTLSIKNYLPFIQFIDEYHHPLVSFSISLAHNTVIYNHQMCFCRWLPIKNIPATHLAHDVWTYCQHVLQEVHTHLPVQQLPEPNIENVSVSIDGTVQSVMHLNDNSIPYSIEVTNCCGDSLVVRVYDHTLPLDERVITWFTTPRPH